jgi:type I restriction enzyme S subunit
MNRLLDGAEVEWKALGELCTIKTGPNINKQIIADRSGPYPVINSGREPLG